MAEKNLHLTPWKRRLIIFGLMACTIQLLIVLFMWRFDISLPLQKGDGCLGGKVWIIDTWDTHYRAGDIMAFEFPIEGDRFFKKGQRFIKKVAATAGDSYDITPDLTVVTSTNGEHRYFQSSVRQIATKIGRDLASISRQGTVPEHQLMMLGELPRSYDSRFWGLVPERNIQGRAYAIF